MLQKIQFEAEVSNGTIKNIRAGELTPPYTGNGTAELYKVLTCYDRVLFETIMGADLHAEASEPCTYRLNEEVLQFVWPVMTLEVDDDVLDSFRVHPGENAWEGILDIHLMDGSTLIFSLKSETPSEKIEGIMKISSTFGAVSLSTIEYAAVKVMPARTVTMTEKKGRLLIQAAEIDVLVDVARYEFRQGHDGLEDSLVIYAPDGGVVTLTLWQDEGITGDTGAGE